ncbi:lantibiotic dehydratase [Nonomuraea sp. NPDC050328]|uniref:lantibiotic dehydratase n=1 Tax=Nonomuraea sp. NPDC050328 TaxID=3364361 RepID=UPI0037A40372
MSALLRIAGLPISTWLAGSAPALFDLLRTLDQAETRYREHAAALADRLAELVPALAVAERRLILSVRRSLHQGRHPAVAALRPIVPDALQPALDEHERLSGLVHDLGRQAARHLDAEHERLLSLPWDLIGARLTHDRESFDIAADIRRRLTAGEPWTSKRLRRSSEYLWRMIARGTVKTTPRGWLGHVALLHLADVETHGVAGQISVSDEAAVEWTQNVHTHRVDLAGAEPLDPEHLISLTPLHWLDDGRLAIWTRDTTKPGSRDMMTCKVRLAAGLDRIVETLGPRARTVGDLTRELPQVSPAFLGKLARRGILDVSAPPHRQRRPWRTITEQETPPETGFVDVYRRANEPLSADLATLQHAFEQCRRIHALIKAEHPQTPPAFLDRLGEQPQPLMDVFVAEAAGRVEQESLASHGRKTGWPPATSPDSAYGRLLALIAAADGPVDIGAGLLDELGAPQAPLTWPTDVMLRPLASGGWVLDGSGPAGVLDARFVDALRWLHGSVPAADHYRAFLDELDRLTGLPSVEVLYPPLSERAANAVRRPRYTRLWTGDPYCGQYWPFWDPDGFLPLGELTVHQADGRVVISHAGRPVRIVQHVTRTATAPWTVLTEILNADSMARASHTRRLGFSLAAHPGRTFVPRITVAGALVVSPAQWSLDPARLAFLGGDALSELRALDRLRTELGLPRWVFLSHHQYGTQPVGCDLESVRAPRVLDQMLKALAKADSEPRRLIITEMIPSPDALPVRAATDPVAAELMIRLPYDLSPQELAARAVSAQPQRRLPMPDPTTPEPDDVDDLIDDLELHSSPAIEEATVNCTRICPFG